MAEEVEKFDVVEEDYLRKVLDFTLLRTRLDYGYSELFQYLFKCRCFGLVRGNGSKLDKNQVLYFRGNSKLEKELDVINLVKAIR